MKRGHTVIFCGVRKFFIPKGVLKWVPDENLKYRASLTKPNFPKK